MTPDFMHDPFAGLPRPKDPFNSFSRIDFMHHGDLSPQRNFFDIKEDFDYVNHLLGSRNTYNKPRLFSPWDNRRY